MTWLCDGAVGPCGSRSVQPALGVYVIVVWLSDEVIITPKGKRRLVWWLFSLPHLPKHLDLTNLLDLSYSDSTLFFTALCTLLWQRHCSNKAHGEYFKCLVINLLIKHVCKSKSYSHSRIHSFVFCMWVSPFRVIGLRLFTRVERCSRGQCNTLESLSLSALFGNLGPKVTGPTVKVALVYSVSHTVV